MAKTAGFDLEVFIAGVAFRARRVECDDTVADLEVGDSEDGEFEAHIQGRKVCKVTIENATFDPTNNNSPFLDPFDIEAGAHIAVQVYPAGTGFDPWDFPDLLVTSAKQTIDVAQLEPISLTGVTNGSYTLPGQVPD